MGIRDLLVDIAATYDVKAKEKTSTGVHAQDLLRGAGQTLAPSLPGDFQAKGNGGSGGPAHTPWIGVYDPDVTLDPKDGLYLAYIFSADLETVTLTLQQGVTRLEKKLGRGRKRRDFLKARAGHLKAALPQALVEDWDAPLLLRCTVDRALAYEAGSVAARCYSTADMPSEESLRGDLWRMADVLQQAAAVEPQLKVEEGPKGIQVEYVPAPHGQATGLDLFRPKNASDYLAHIPERTITKKRTHESLVKAFGPYVLERGFVPITEKVHPRDLVLRQNDAEWLVEAKTIKRGNPTVAVREAVGQLLEYSYFWYQLQGQAKPHLLALFTEDIHVYAEYLEQHGIAAVWRTLDGWAGSASAVSWGLVD
ncbi:MrcB family domain-containing protein [Streptomyces syringium]|uniref:MrcB family domain-containing protein n=1 Tax=Streptomyces syringium TaxID=76729 RepID=UPI0034448912